MVHYMKLDSVPFELVSLGKKSIELRLYDEKRRKIQPDDIIVFSEKNSCRTIQVNVDSILVARTFNKLFDMISSTECGSDDGMYPDMTKYYSADSLERNDVVGIRFSVDNSRDLREVIICEKEADLFILNCISKQVDSINRDVLHRWYGCFHDKCKLTDENNALQDIVDIIDTSFIDFVYERTFELSDKIDEQGYGNLYEYLDRNVSLEELYPEISWWKNTRKELINYFAGGNQQKIDEIYFYAAFEMD